MSISSIEYDRLCHAHINIIKRYLFHKISNPADAEDILQEILLATYKGFDKLRDTAAFKSWVLGIASRKCADYYRAKARSLEVSLDEASESIPARSYDIELSVNDTLDKLPDRDKQILYLFYIRGYNQKDIATKLGIQLGTVKSRVSAAKEKFRKQYNNQEE